jgi:hypothetical protein
MARQIVDIARIGELLALTNHQVYHLVRRPVDPLPHRKIGKQLRFDVDQCFRWFDRQPGRSEDDFSDMA